MFIRNKANDYLLFSLFLCVTELFAGVMSKLFAGVMSKLFAGHNLKRTLIG